MTNALALVLAILIVALVAADTIWNDHQASLFLARRAIDLIQQLAFWR